MKRFSTYLGSFAKLVYYLGSRPNLNSRDAKIAKLVKLGLSLENQKIFDDQLKQLQFVRSMFHGRIKFLYLNRWNCPRFKIDEDSNTGCLGIVGVKNGLKKGKAALIVKEGFLYSLEFSPNPARDYEPLNLLPSRKWKGVGGAIQRLEHGKDFE